VYQSAKCTLQKGFSFLFVLAKEIFLRSSGEFPFGCLVGFCVLTSSLENSTQQLVADGEASILGKG